MLTAIRDIGRWLRRTKNIEELETLIQAPFENTDKKFVLFVKINIDESKYEGVVREDYDSTKIQRYLYRRGSSNGPNTTPAAKITDDVEKKTFPQKITAWFKKYRDLDDTGIVAQIGDVLLNNQNKIIEDIKNALRKDDKNVLLTIKVVKQNQEHYLGDLEVFRTLLKTIVNTQVGKGSTAKHICSICGEKKQVSGDPRIFNFYTIDKPGFIAGGFNKADAWKNFPLCYECKLDIEEGRRYVEQKLQFKFHGLNYFLIPRLLFSDVQPELMKILLDTKKIISLKEQAKKRITNDENDILEIVSREKDVLTVNFLFLRKEQSAERILLLIEDIFPSRLREIFAAKDRVDTLFSRSDYDDFTFEKIRTFFAHSSEGKRDYDLDKYFLEIVDATFRGKKIDFSFLIEFCMAVIRREFIKEEREGDFKKRVDDALMVVMFLKELGLLSFKEASSMKESIFSEVFKKYAGMLNSPEKTGVFLLGALTQLLLSKQYSVRGAKPFKKHLKGLRMDEKDFRALLPKVQHKLEEYDSFDKGKAQIAEAVSRSFLEAGENWKVAVDELNFYFVCGMNLAPEIAAVVYKDKKEKEV